MKLLGAFVGSWFVALSLVVVIEGLMWVTRRMRPLLPGFPEVGVFVLLAISWYASGRALLKKS